MSRRAALLALAVGCVPWSALAQRVPPETVRSYSVFPGSPDPWNRVPTVRSTVKDWKLTGSNATAYELKCDVIFDCWVAVLRTRARTTAPFGTGSLTHTAAALPYRGRRLKLSAELKAGTIAGWAGLWMRVDSASGQPLAFDNMQTRPLVGTTGYQWHEVVLDVPGDAERISLGVMLHGPGAVMIREIRLEEVEPSRVASTDLIGPLKAQVTAAAAP